MVDLMFVPLLTLLSLFTRSSNICRPEIFRMIEFNDNTELQTYSTAVLYVLSAFTPPTEYIPIILNNFVSAIKSATVLRPAIMRYERTNPSQSYRIRLRALPSLVVFFYRNLLSIKPDGVNNVMEMLLTCLSDENVEVRMKASEALSGIVRCSQRQSIIQLKVVPVLTTLWIALLTVHLESIRFDNPQSQDTF